MLTDTKEAENDSKGGSFTDVQHSFTHYIPPGMTYSRGKQMCLAGYVWCGGDGGCAGFG